MKTLVLFLPGNPSVPGVYVPFLEKLKSHFIESVNDGEEIHYEVLHHLGQCNIEMKKYKQVSLHDVIEDHKKTIERKLKEYNAQQVFLISHSLGSAVSLMLHESFKAEIKRFIILCPFLGPSEKNASYLKLFKNPISRSSLMYASYMILSNNKISQRFFKKWLGDNELNTQIISEIKKPGYIKNFFSLVSGYFESFDQLEIRKSLDNVDKSKTYFIFAKEDFWVPKEAVSCLPEGVKKDILEDISHDFCLFEDEYTKVANYVFRDLKENRI
jgi:predicted alpha/beta hydrolase family esterase